MEYELPSSDDEYDSDEPLPVVINLQELRRRAGLAVSRACTNIRKLTKGRFHEIFTLSFHNSDLNSHDTLLENCWHWSCIARISRQPEPVQKLVCEVETMKYVRLHTSIPVPEVYHYDFDAGNSVGAQFILMEQNPGQHLYKIWDKLSLGSQESRAFRDRSGACRTLEIEVSRDW